MTSLHVEAFGEQLQWITHQSRLAGPELERQLTVMLNELVVDGEHWIRGMERQAIGETWRALGDYDKAIDSYRQAMIAGGSGAGFDVIAQLSTAYAHRGSDLVRRDVFATEEDFAKAFGDC